MYDINFFSVYKKKRSKSNGLKIFIIIFCCLFVVANALLIGGGLYLFSQIEHRIADKQAEIDSEATKIKVQEATKIRTQTLLSSEYLKILTDADGKINQLKTFDSKLLDKVRGLTPATTKFTFTEYNGVNINLECFSGVITDPMDMYHAFLKDPAFATVTLSGITVLAGGEITFNVICQLAGGEQQ